ncbi:sigma-70 family RNA polymerase sigma factor [Anaeroselena agilis]|uniref:RNA polymerase sigma factor SigS n=1 Tax=Anaeroselena agilis TaxID=3063788 RepID=A0ABU3P308_9FIRM|nr:sigma-70 family RNA polymerase sigma factor [Selenomonadales bacterium 4137-cl]
MVVISSLSDTQFADIVAEYKGLVRAMAKKFYFPGSDREDVIQEGMMGLYKAALAYKPDGRTSFRSFAAMVINRHLITALKTARRGKALVLTSAERLENRVQEDRYAHIKEVGEIIPGAATDPLATIIAEEEAATFIRRLKKVLSPLEMEVLQCRLAGYTIQETAATLARSPKAVDNALTRIKNKFRVETEILKRAIGQ